MRKVARVHIEPIVDDETSAVVTFRPAAEGSRVEGMSRGQLVDLGVVPIRGAGRHAS